MLMTLDLLTLAVSYLSYNWTVTVWGLVNGSLRATVSLLRDGT